MLIFHAEITIQTHQTPKTSLWLCGSEPRSGLSFRWAHQLCEQPLGNGTVEKWCLFGIPNVTIFLDTVSLQYMWHISMCCSACHPAQQKCIVLKWNLYSIIFNNVHSATVLIWDPRGISLIASSKPFFPGFASIGVQPSRTQVVCRRWQMLRRATPSRWFRQDFTSGPMNGCYQRYGGFLSHRGTPKSAMFMGFIVDL